MSRIVLATIGSLGDLHPKIALGLELRDRGHQVIFVTSKQYCERIEFLGFEFHRLRPDYISPDDPQMLALMMDTRRGTERLLRDYIFANIRDTYTDLLEASQGADFLIVGEVVYAGRLVAEKLGLKWALGVLSPASFCSVYDPPVFPGFSGLEILRSMGLLPNQAIVTLGQWMTRSWSAPLHQLRQEIGLPPSGNPIFQAKFSPYLVLALFSPVLAAPQADWAPSTVITGFTFYDRTNQSANLSPELEQFLAAGDPPIIFTLGSAAVHDPGDFYRVSLEVAQQLKRRAVMLIGNNPPPPELPDTIKAVDYAPYSKIFPHACAIVHQGGVGTTAQALRSGHPTVVVPYSHDQPDNAARVERLGISRTIPRDRYTTHQAVQELSILLQQPAYAAKAESIGTIVQLEMGEKVACDAIEKQLTLKT
ncbi:glycosyltransferase [Leptolyngbyaceae cyanobacterium UHCC 1019]